MDEEQERRIALEEARFRALNERQVGATGEFRDGGSGHDLDVLCECAVAHCDQMLTVSVDRYAHARTNPRWFIVLPGHVVEAAEDVVEQDEGSWIIEKVPGVGADVAEREA